MAAWIVQGPGFHPSTDQSCTQIGKKVGDSSVGKVVTRQEDLPAFRKSQHPHERQAGWGGSLGTSAGKWKEEVPKLAGWPV